MRDCGAALTLMLAIRWTEDFEWEETHAKDLFARLVSIGDSLVSRVRCMLGFVGGTLPLSGFRS